MRGRGRLLVMALACVAGCGDSTNPGPTPGPLTLAVTPRTRSFGVNQDSIQITTDSVVVALSGAGADSTRWSATHDTANSWLTFVTPAGAGSGVVRWVLNPIYLAPGTYVDTIAITANGAEGSPAPVVDTLTVRS